MLVRSAHVQYLAADVLAGRLRPTNLSVDFVDGIQLNQFFHVGEMLEAQYL
jgi:hypothetical protein